MKIQNQTGQPSKGPTAPANLRPGDVASVIERYGIPGFTYHTWSTAALSVREPSSDGAPGLAQGVVDGNRMRAEPISAIPTLEKSYRASVQTPRGGTAIPNLALPTITDLEPPLRPSANTNVANPASERVTPAQPASLPPRLQLELHPETPVRTKTPSAMPNALPARSSAVITSERVIPQEATRAPIDTVGWEEPGDLRYGTLPILARITDPSSYLARLHRGQLGIVEAESRSSTFSVKMPRLNDLEEDLGNVATTVVEPISQNVSASTRVASVMVRASNALTASDGGDPVFPPLMDPFRFSFRGSREETIKNDPVSRVFERSIPASTKQRIGMPADKLATTVVPTDARRAESVPKNDAEAMKSAGRSSSDAHVSPTVGVSAREILRQVALKGIQNG